MNARIDNIDELMTKVKMLVEQNEMLRRHNNFLLQENNTISREFANFRRNAGEKEQNLTDSLEKQRRIEQQQTAKQRTQYNELQIQLRALEQGIEELYKQKI